MKLDEIRRVLANTSPQLHDRQGDWAAVALILRERHHRSEVLLIRRPEHPTDPWSGHMAFPGGRHDSKDQALVQTALRETQEEIGLDLDIDTQLIGQIDDVHARAKGKHIPLTIRPFVFALDSDPTIFPNSKEVAETLWAPLDALHSGKHDTTYHYVFSNGEIDLPGYDIDGRIVWGITHQMLQSFFSLLR